VILAENRRRCATCVFWAARGEPGGQSSGRCRALQAGAISPAESFLTLGDFVCAQWCGRPLKFSAVG
jgi:hypothetical protein